jgi:hypothetical protein
MIQTQYVETNRAFTLVQPEASGWKCELFGMGSTFVLFPYKKDLPNRFWRLMQYILFGNKWVKMPK